MVAPAPIRVETLSELQIWIEGKFALVAQTQDTSRNEMVILRKTVHDFGNQLMIITALNLPEKLASLQAADKEHEKNIDQFTLDAAERRSAFATLKLVYIVLGAALGGALTFGLQLYRLAH